MPPKYSDEDVDDLDDILDEFSKPPASKPAPSQSTTTQQQPATTTDKDKALSSDNEITDLSDDFAKEFAKQMEEMMRGLSVADTASSSADGAAAPAVSDDEAKLFKELWDKMIIEELEADPRATPPDEPSKITQDSQSATKNKDGTSSTEDPFQRAIREAMEKLQTSETQLRNQSGSNSSSENPLETLLSSFRDEADPNENLEDMLQSMMSQLMSKEILYEPLKELHEKFPPYLRDNAKDFSEDDKKRYEAQYECVDKIIKTFEEPGYSDDDPKYSSLVLEHMNVMQGHGSPPAAIMGEMPPGFDLGGDGQPKLPDGCILS